MKKVQLERWAYIGGEEKENEYIVAVNFWVGKDGIGAYECHGYRGYDVGRDCLEDWEIVSVVRSPEFGKEPRPLEAFSKEVQEELEKQMEAYAEDGALVDALEKIEAEDAYRD